MDSFAMKVKNYHAKQKQQLHSIPLRTMFALQYMEFGVDQLFFEQRAENLVTGQLKHADSKSDRIPGVFLKDPIISPPPGVVITPKSPFWRYLLRFLRYCPEIWYVISFLQSKHFSNIVGRLGSQQHPLLRAPGVLKSPLRYKMMIFCRFFL